jgi:polyhydroxybutyrate depolymerase
LAVFGKAASCGSGKTTVAVPGRNASEAPRAFVGRRKRCKAPVELVRIGGGGPGCSDARHNAATDPRNGDIDGAAIIRDFFREAG